MFLKYELKGGLEKWKQFGYELREIGNMDKTPVYFDQLFLQILLRSV